MGGSYSDLHVYFHSKKTEKYSGTGYTVTVTQQNFTDCSNFVVFNHQIEFTKNFDGRNYNFILYDGTDKKNEGNPVFGYYYPKDINQVVQSVSTYYSVLDLDFPLAVSFKCGGNIYNCDLGKLKYAGWDRAYNISDYSFSNHLTKEDLIQRFHGLSRKKTIRFKLGNEKLDITAGKQELGDDKHYRFIFIPTGNESVLGSDYMFAIDFNKNEPLCSSDLKAEILYDCKRLMFYKLCTKKGKTKEDCKANINSHSLKPSYFKLKHPNIIDEYFLRQFDGEIYDGIMVYFDRESNKPPGQWCRRHEDNNNTALLLEFVFTQKPTIQIIKKDKYGYWWSQESVKYNSDKELLLRLGEIKQHCEDVVTVILDEKKKYLGVDDYKEEKHTSYIKYTYKFSKKTNPVFLFAKQKIQLGKFDNNFTTNTVRLYYLTVSGRDDTQPFLIVFFSDGRSPNTKKVFHFMGNYGFVDWVEFNFDFKKPDAEGPGDDREKDLLKKLEDKLNKIDKYCACLSNITTVRWYTHQILVDPEFKPPEPPPTKPPERPNEVIPDPPPQELPVWLIVGCVAAGVVLIVAAAVGYGIYWYNTTIKLLT